MRLHDEMDEMITTYEVNCIEHGEHFYFHMETNETNRDKIMAEAREEASGWGAEVINIKRKCNG
jgi:hypothetical protein